MKKRKQNTNEVVAYINECKSFLHKKEKVVIDIENVQNLSPDAIALLVACANDPHFSCCAVETSLYTSQFRSVVAHASQRDN